MIDRAACIFAYNKNPILVVTSTGAAMTKISATALNAVFEGDQGRLARDGPAQQAGSSPARGNGVHSFCGKHGSRRCQPFADRGHACGNVGSEHLTVQCPFRSEGPSLVSRLPCQARKAKEQGSEARNLVPRKSRRRSNWRLDHCVPVATAAAGVAAAGSSDRTRTRARRRVFHVGHLVHRPKRSAALVSACFNHECSKKRLNYALRPPKQ